MSLDGAKADLTAFLYVFKPVYKLTGLYFKPKIKFVLISAKFIKYIS